MKVISFSRMHEDQQTVADVPAQASGFNIRNQSCPVVAVPSCHDVMAMRQLGDELRVMDICKGTFPFFPASLCAHERPCTSYITSVPAAKPNILAQVKPTCGATFDCSLHQSQLDPYWSDNPHQSQSERHRIF